MTPKVGHLKKSWDNKENRGALKKIVGHALNKVGHSQNEVRSSLNKEVHA